MRAWRKACHANNTCVWVAPEDGAVLMRDEQGEILPVTAPAWRALIAGVKAQ